MITEEYGKQNKEVILLLHGGGLGTWNYREAAELLQEKYYVVIPCLDGHAGSDRNFVSIEDNARELIQYIDEVHGGSVALIGGLSLGGQILVEMLSQRSDICEAALIESALVLPMKMTHALVKPMLDMSFGLIRKNWFSKLQFESLRIKKAWYEAYYRDTCSITKENMITFLKANSFYDVKEELRSSRAKAYIYVGRKESSKMLRSAQRLNELLPGSRLRIMDNRYHGEFSINYAKEYATTVMDILENRRKNNE